MTNTFNPLIYLIIGNKPDFMPLISQNNMWPCFWVGNSIHKSAPSSRKTMQPVSLFSV